jgi:hypothetical protein
LNTGVYGESNIFIIYTASQQLSLELDQLPHTLVALITAESWRAQPRALTHLSIDHADPAYLLGDQNDIPCCQNKHHQARIPSH